MENKPSLPFLRWAGGKQWLVKKISDYYNNNHKKYYEPFIGGGSLFFSLSPKDAVLGDSNKELINTYRVVRDYPYELISNLKKLNNDKETYYLIREKESEDTIERASNFIFLNKTCWNGLYRVNQKGKFNVPFGNNNRAVFYPDTIIRASQALKTAKLLEKDFEETLKSANEGDFIYLDPPYTVLHSHNGFRHYNEKLFSWNDQIRLAKISNELAFKKCTVIISNAAVDEILDLYENFEVVKINRHSILAANSKYRRKIEEVLLISNNRM